MTFSFKGTSLMLYGLMDSQGANMIIQLDSGMSMVNTSTGIGGATQQPALLFESDNLDPNVVHTLTVGWLGNGESSDSPETYMYFRQLTVNDYIAVYAHSLHLCYVWMTYVRSYRAPSASLTVAPEATPTLTQIVSSTKASMTLPTPLTSSVALSSTSQRSVGPGAVVGAILASLVVFAAFVFMLVRYIRGRYQHRLLAPSKQFKLFISSQRERRVDGDIESLSPAESTTKAVPYVEHPIPLYRLKNGKSEASKVGSMDKPDSMSYLDFDTSSSEYEDRMTLKDRIRRTIRLSYPPRAHARRQKRKPAPRISTLSSDGMSVKGKERSLNTETNGHANSQQQAILANMNMSSDLGYITVDNGYRKGGFLSVAEEKTRLAQAHEQGDGPSASSSRALSVSGDRLPPGEPIERVLGHANGLSYDNPFSVSPSGKSDRPPSYTLQ